MIQKREKIGEELKSRLKEMHETRKSIFKEIKKLNEWYFIAQSIIYHHDSFYANFWA